MVTPWYPYPGNDLYGIFVTHFAKRLSEHHKITVVALIEQADIKEWSLIRKQISPNFEEIVQLIPRAANPVNRVLRRKKASRRLIDSTIPSLRSFDLVHFHVLSPLHYCFVSEAIKMRIPYVVTEHWTIYARGLFQKLNSISRLRMKKMAMHASAVMPVSTFLQKSMVNCGIRANYVVVPNMVPEIANSGHSKYDEPTLLGVGDLVDGVKNFSGMIRTLRELHDRERKFHLHIVGHGPDRQKLEELTGELNLSEFVRFIGELPHEKVLKEMQRCHIYLMTSPLETFSISTLEALKCGTAIVTTDCGGIHEYFEDLGGIIVNPFDTEQFATAVISISDHPEWYRQEALRNAFGPKCTPIVVIEKLNEVYDNAVRK